MGRKKNSEKRKFIINKDGSFNVYIDGCCLNPNREISASGYGIYWGPENRCKVYGPCKKKATNNHAEIQSAYIAIALARQLRVKKLCINTDSKVVFDAATDLIQKWEENDWKSLYDGRSIADRRYWEKLAFELEICKIQGMEIQFNLVEGHSGNEYHNEADHLAKKGAELHCNYKKLLLVNLNYN